MVPALVVSCAVLLIGSANAHLRTFPYIGVYGRMWLCRKSCVLSKLVRSPLWKIYCWGTRSLGSDVANRMAPRASSSLFAHLHASAKAGAQAMASALGA